MNKVRSLFDQAVMQIDDMLCYVINGSIARSATRRYLIYSEADSEVLRPTGPLLHAKFHNS